jgi:nanoRNase/pAp phosphatase (c-di-AMP/oligoRNAs hydrolase)
MGLKPEEYKAIREALDDSAKPLFFFHDDADGACSFLQLYAYKGDGKGVIVKSHPKIDTKFLRKVEENSPDAIFVVDLALMEQEFVDSAKTKIVWIDHHPPQEIHGVKYYNPRKHDSKSNPSASYLCYKAVEAKLWIAMVGSIGDMQWPADLVDEFREKYPDMLPKDIKTARDALFKSKVGLLVKIVNFVLKGTSSDAMKYVKVLSRIAEPDEILEQTTSQGKYIYKRYEFINREYEKLLRTAESCATKDPVLLFTYQESSMSFSSDLANELVYRHPDKLVMMCREKSGEMKCSLRSNKHVLPPIIQKALVGCHGYGGGHEHASGAVVKSEDFVRFMEQLRPQL